MPKKNQKKEQKKPALQIVDEQKQPCLRALQKKVRNLNKKLTQIADLKTKNDLKPQQIQKIQRQNEVEQQKAKFLEFIQIYHQVIKQNQKAIRNVQINELKEVATVLAAKEYSQKQKLPQSKDLDSLISVLSKPSSNSLTLNQRIQQITSQMIKIANDKKLKGAYIQFAEQNPNLTISLQEEKQQQQKVPQVQQQKQQPIVQQVKNQQPPVSIPEPVQEVPQPELVVQKNEDKPKDQPQKVPAETQKPNQEAVPEQKKVQGQERKPYSGKRKRQYQKRDQLGERKPRNNYRNNKDKEGGERKNRTFKPKYAPKQDGQNKNEQEDSYSGESSPQVREFKREERKQLKNEGFIIMEKKKKPRAREQKQWHDHQHGKKHHHHHGPKNS